MLLVLMLLLIPFLAPPSVAQPTETKLTASDGAPGDQFGYPVRIDADIVVIGSYQDDDQGPNSGAAYVFRRNGTGWIEEQKLTPSDGPSGHWFGVQIDIDGKRPSSTRATMMIRGLTPDRPMFSAGTEPLGTRSRH